MANATERTEQTETQTKQRRIKQAAIVAGLQAALEPDEQLLAFARGKISGGWRGKFAIGLEAFFAPDVNVGLTERHFVLQHIHATNGTPSDILPHKFPLEDIASITFGDIETFGGEPAGRLVMRLQDEQHFRVKVYGALNCEDSAAVSEVFRSLTSARRKSGLSPTQSVCPHCGHILDRPSKFCPYCGKTVTPDAPDANFHAAPMPSEATEMEAAETTPPPDFTVSERETPLAAFTAPDFSEAAEEEIGAAVMTEDYAPGVSQGSGAADFVMQDEAGEDLFPEIPISASHEEPAEMPDAPVESADTTAHIAFDALGVPTIELEITALDGIAAASGGDSLQNPKPEVQNLSAVPSASTAFWREFARISGVATPEVFAPQTRADSPKSDAPTDELSKADAEKPAFPLSQEENEPNGN